jgi:hypothetical protein
MGPGFWAQYRTFGRCFKLVLAEASGFPLVLLLAVFAMGVLQKVVAGKYREFFVWFQPANTRVC